MQLASCFLVGSYIEQHLRLEIAWYELDDLDRQNHCLY